MRDRNSGEVDWVEMGDRAMIRRFAVLPALLLASSLTANAQETKLNVMVFNIWGGGANEGKPVDETVAAIKAANADIIALMETRLESDPCTADSCPATGDSAAPAIAAALGFNVYDQKGEGPTLWANAVISRYPITGTLKDELGVSIDVNGKTVYMLAAHLDDSPYQPYQLLGIEYGDAPFIKTEAEAIEWAEKTRGAAMDSLIAAAGGLTDAAAIFIAGDFNEPSNLDWTEAAVKAGQQPVAVAWPATSKLEKAGFVDLYRAANPDPVAKPAFTWTPTSEPSDPEDHHDRIDFVFGKAPGLKVTSASIVGEKQPEADIVVTPWPSDHRAVVATVEF